MSVRDLVLALMNPVELAMEWHTCSYALKDLPERVRRTGVPFFVNVLSLACGLFLLAGHHTLHGHAERLLAESASTPRLHVFLHRGAPVEEQESILSEIEKWPGIRDIRFLRRITPSKEGREPRGPLEEAVEGVWLENAAMRIDITFTSDGNPSFKTEGVIERLKGFRHVQGVLDDRSRVERLEPLQSFLTTSGSWFTGLLVSLSLLISLACSAAALKSDAEEIEVSLLVGGSRLQVFLPLYCRAVLAGILAWAISALAVLTLLDSVRWLLPGVTLMHPDWTHWELPLFFAGMALAAVVLSCAGCWGSLWHARHSGTIRALIDARVSSSATRRNP